MVLGKDEEVTIRVAVVDDQRLFTRGLSGLVDMLPEMEVVLAVTALSRRRSLSGPSTVRSHPLPHLRRSSHETTIP